jgi:hypothetical protein
LKGAFIQAGDLKSFLAEDNGVAFFMNIVFDTPFRRSNRAASIF